MAGIDMERQMGIWELGVKSAVPDGGRIDRGGRGRPSGRLQVSALPDCSAPRWEPALTQLQGDCQKLSVGCAEIATPGEEMWGGKGALGMQV